MVQLEKLNTELTNQLELLQVEYNNKAEAYLRESKTLSDLGTSEQGAGTTGFPEQASDLPDKCTESDAGKQVTFIYSITEKADKAIRDIGKENGFFMYSTYQRVSLFTLMNPKAPMYCLWLKQNWGLSNSV